jgi:hypothetical protein
MIKLFRSFRRSLINQAKSEKSKQNTTKDTKVSNPSLSKAPGGKYLLYAIGEIVLVVIGILFALQINNWNLDRIERKNEGIILLDLKVEFQENLKDAERVSEGNIGIYKAMSAIQRKAAIRNYEQRELDSLMYFVFDWFDYTPKPGASNNLINSGNLNLIRNKDLRKLLTLWSGVDAELDDDESVALRYSEDVIIPFLTVNYPISNLEEFDGDIDFYKREGSGEIGFQPTKNLPYKVDALLQNTTFMSHISVKKMHARHNAMECVEVVNTCRTILDLIQIELDERSK